MKKTIVLLASLTFAAFSIAADTKMNNSSVESVKELMDKTGTGEMAVQAMNQMLPMIKKMVPDAPEAFWLEFQKEMNPNELVDMIFLFTKSILPSKISMQ